jgi:protein CWC15
MTTAHKPTYHPAVGSATQGGFRYHAPKTGFSVKDIAAYTELKVRQTGQGTQGEIATRDLKAELEDREREHAQKGELEKKRKGLLPYAENSVDPNKELEKIDFKKFDDSDDSDEQGNSDSDKEDDEDDEAELQRELAKLRKEKDEEKAKKIAQAKSEEDKLLNEEILKGNPLMNTGDDSALKRRWDDDVVFKNQSRDQKKVVKRFINDTIRSDFHRNFLKKYVQ